MRTLREFFAPRSLIKFALLLIAMNGFASGLTSSLTGIRAGAFLTIALCAVIFAWLLAFSRFQTGDFWILLFSIGTFFIFIQAAQLWGVLGAVIDQIFEYLAALVRYLFRNPPPDFLPLRSAFDTFMGASAQMLQRIVAAIQAGSLEDAGVRELLWGFPILVLSGWAGWALKRRDNVLLALGPSLGLVAYVLYYTGTKPGSLQVIVCSFLFLMGMNEWEKRISQKTMTAGLEKASSDVNLTLIILSIAITLAAGLTPSLTLKSTIDRIQQSASELKNQQLAAALGLQDDPNSRHRFATNGLPQKHLVGAPPAIAQTIMFRVKTGELPPLSGTEFNDLDEPVPHYYWRSLTYDLYTGKGWETTLSKTQDYAANQSLFESIPPGYRAVHLDFSKTKDADSLVYWTGTLIRVDQSFELGWRSLPGSIPQAEDPLGGADALGATTAPYNFQVDSILPTPSIDQLRAASQDYPESIKNRYLALPESLPERVPALAQQITQGITNPYEQASALEAHLRTYPYSLDVPPPPNDRDVADYFLFTLGTGYCDYYATSMVVMARSLGLPARLVSGYASGTYIPSTAEYVVRQANAHSWPEIYFTGIGWVEFEPTANQPEIERSPSVQDNPPAAPPEHTDPEENTNANTPSWIPAGYVPFLGILLVTAVGAGAAFYLFQSYRFSKADIKQIYPWIFKMGNHIAPLPGIPETPFMFAERLRVFLGRIPQPQFISQWLAPALSELEFLTRLYVRAMYSPHSPTESEDARARHLWQKLYWRLLLARVLRPRVTLSTQRARFLKNSRTN